jgi:hypothetical protein
MKAFIRISKKNATQQEKEGLIKTLHEIGYTDNDFIIEEQEQGVLIRIKEK